MACVPISTPVNNRENGEDGWQDGVNDLVKCAGGFGRNENAKASRRYRVRRRMPDAPKMSATSVGRTPLCWTADQEYATRIASIDVNPFLINSKVGVAVDGLIVLNNEAAEAARKAAKH